MTATQVRIEPWASRQAVPGLSASIYAVAPEVRVEAARVAHEAGMSIHADVIVAPSAGSETGWVNRAVTADQLVRVRSELPDAAIDVHIMTRQVEKATAVTAVAAILADVLPLAPRSVTVDCDVFDACEATWPQLRERGIGVWGEIAPAESADGVLKRADALDGALVMLIEPGTKTAAAPRLLERIRLLHERVTSTRPGFALAVDGGVTAQLAADAASVGATSIVSGRALFDLADHAVASATPQATP